MKSTRGRSIAVENIDNDEELVGKNINLPSLIMSCYCLKLYVLTVTHKPLEVLLHLYFTYLIVVKYPQAILILVLKPTLQNGYLKIFGHDG